MTTDLPSGWEVARLSDLGTEVRGQISPEPGTTYDLYSVPAFPTGQPEQVDGKSIKSGKRPVEEHDVLLCKINPRINRVWTVGASHGQPQIASTEYLVLRLHEPRMAAYVRYYLSSPGFRDWIKLAVEGATGSHTRAKSGPILEQSVPVPPLAEQHRIVAAIEEHFSRLDAAEASIADAEAKCAALPSIAMSRLFSPKWPKCRLGAVAQVGSGATPKRSETEYWSHGTIPWVTSGAVNQASIWSADELISERALAETSVKLWPAGTVLMAMYGEGKTRGRAAVLEFESTCNQACAAINFDRSLLDGRFLRTFLNVQYEANRRLSSGGVQPNLNLGLVKAMEIPVPRLEIQASVANQADEIVSASAELLAACMTARRRVSALRRSVLVEAFAGRLVPLDPANEPVGASLCRSSSEKSTR